jgi:hypothetical protein
MVAFFLFLPPSHYTKKTYLTILNPTTPLEKRDRVHVNFCNKQEGMKKILYFDIIHPSALRSVPYGKASPISRFQKKLNSGIFSPTLFTNPCASSSKNQKAINCKEKLPDIKKGVTFIYIRKKSPTRSKPKLALSSEVP